MGGYLGTSMGSVEKQFGKEDILDMMKGVQKRAPEISETVRKNLKSIMEKFATKIDQTAKVFDSKAKTLRSDAQGVVENASKVLHSQVQKLRSNCDNASDCSKKLKEAIDATMTECRRVMSALNHESDANSKAVIQSAKGVLEDATTAADDMTKSGGK